MRKILFSSLFSLGALAGFVQAQTITLSNIKFSPASPADLTTNDTVFASFDYINAHTGSIWVTAVPTWKGSPISITSYNSYIPLSPGSGSGQKRYFFVGKVGKADSVRFTVKNENNSIVLLTKSVPVNYTFNTVVLKNIKFNPPSPAELTTKDTVFATFDYINAHTGSIWVTAVPTLKGAPISLTSYNSYIPLSPGSGNGQKRYFFVGYVGKADSVRFTVKNENNSVVLLTKSVPVNYSFQQFMIKSVRFTPQAPSSLTSKDTVWATFDYFNGHTGNVWISALPYFKGSAVSVTSYNTYIPLAPGSGTGQKRYFYVGKAGETDTVRITIKNETQTATLFTLKLPARYVFSVITAYEDFGLLESPGFYPNPSASEVQIKTSKAGTLKLMDLRGSVLKQEQVEEGTHTLLVADLEEGMYLLAIEGKVEKLLIKR